MVAIITGDIINSRKATSAEEWLSVLKDALGKEEIWEIFRGDSFQLKTDPQNAFLKAIYIKACLKTIKEIDVRIAIGIGGEGFNSDKLTESNGEAFIFSGEKFELLKKEKLNLAIKTASADFDEEFNLLFRLACVLMDKWPPVSAGIVKLALENLTLSQLELAEIAGRTQSSISEALKRANFFEILELNTFYLKKLNVIDPSHEPASH